MIRSSDVRPWVAHAATVALSLTMFIGFGVYSRESMTGEQAAFAKEVFTGCRWAAITCAVVAGPVTGALAQTSLERVLGTIIGGLCGFLVCWMATPVANAYEWTVYALMAGAFGWAAVYMGHRLSLNYSFKLAIITFLLVFAGADDLEEARTIAFTRALGIIAGVTMTLILSVSILPVSAHHQHDEALNKALRALLSLQALCWLPLTHAHEAHVPSFLSPTPTAHPQLSRGPLPNENSPQASIHAEHSHEHDADGCTAPLISPRSPPHSPHASPQRSGRVTPDSAHDDSYHHGAGLGSSLSAGGACSSQGVGVLPSPAHAALSVSHSAPPNSLPNVSQQGAHGALSSGALGGQSSAQDARRSSLGGCGASSGRGSFAGLVKRSEFASVNWEMHNLKLNEEGDIRSAEDIVVEVYSALSAAEAALAISEREIYAGRIFGRPFYIPRFVASIVCMGGQRAVPTKQAKAACGAARGAARVLLALHSLLKEGTDSVVKEVLHERYPGALMPDVVKFSGFAIQDCIEAFNRGSPVCGSSLELLRTTVATLISISGAHRSRIHHQYQTYRAVAHDLRARLYARSSGSRSHTPSNQGSINAQQGLAGVFASFRSRGGPPNHRSLTLSSPGGTAGAAVVAGRPPRHSGGLDGPSGNWGRKVWRAISGRLSTSFGQSAPAMSGNLQRAAADEESGATQALLQVCTERDSAAQGAESNSPSDNSTSSDQPRVTSPFSSLQGQDGLVSPDAMRLSFSVHRNESGSHQQRTEGMPATHSIESQRADEGQTLRQMSGGLTTKPSQSTHTSQHTTPDGATTSAQTRRITAHGALLASQHLDGAGNTRNATTPPFSLSPREPPSSSYSQNAMNLASLPEKRHNASSDTLPTLASQDTSRPAVKDLLRTPHSSSTFQSSDTSPPAPIHGQMEHANVSALSSVAFPSHRQSFTDSFMEGEHSENRIFSTRDSFAHTDDMAYGSNASPLLPTVHVGKGFSPHSGYAHAQVVSRSPDAPLRETCTAHNSRASHADLGAFGSAVGVAPDTDKVPSQGNLLFPQPSSMTDGGTPHGRMKHIAAPLPRTFSAGASKAGASAATPHAFASAGSATLTGRIPSGDLGEAQRLLARSGTQPLLMFPDTPEGYYAEITYYTFQFHLEEIVDATEQLQSTLCDLIRAMPRNAADLKHSAHVRI